MLRACRFAKMPAMRDRGGPYAGRPWPARGPVAELRAGQAWVLCKARTERGWSSRYGLPIASETIVLERESWSVPPSYPLAGGQLVPLRASETIAWRLT